MASGAKFSGFPFHWGRLPCPAPGPAETRLAALCYHSRQRQELNPRVEITF